MDSSSSIPESTESFSHNWLSSENSTTSNETPTRLDGPLNDSFHFEINSGGVTDRRPCYAEELFSNGLIRRSFPDDYVDYYFSPAAALKQPVSLDRACVCPAPPVLPAPPSSVDGRRRHHRAVSCCRKTILGQFCWSVRKCFLMPFLCGISRVDDIDTISAVKARTSSDFCHGGRPGAVSPARCSGSAEKWIEFENPIYEAVLHCKRSCSLDASNNR